MRLHTIIICLLIPIRIRGNVLRLLSLLLVRVTSTAALEHLFEELELRLCELIEEEGGEEDEWSAVHGGLLNSNDA